MSETSGGTYSFASAYEYDLAGNRHKKTRTGSGADTVTYTYNDNDELSQENSTLDGQTTYQYDDNGSLTSKATTNELHKPTIA